jgi:uncharacterized membrane protein YbhN (UPF0104 family)
MPGSSSEPGGASAAAAGPSPPPRHRRAELIIRLARTVGYVGSIAIVVFFAVKALRDAPKRDLDVGLLVLAFVPTLAWWLLLARAWSTLMSGKWTLEDATVWCRTQALRYLPGGIWAPASRLAVAGGTTRNRLTTVAAENVGALCAAMTLGGLGLTLDGRFAYAPLILALALIPIGTRLKLLPPRAIATVPGYTIGFGSYLLGCVLVQAAVSGWHDPLAVAGAAGVAWGVGLVVIIAPGGIGVREVVYVGLLSSAFPKGDLAAGAVTMRLVTIGAELLVLAITGAFLQRRVVGNR